MEILVYDTTEAKITHQSFGTDLDANPVNHGLLYRVINALRENKRGPVAHAKDRRERRGGGTKPWRQKGTGRARHGSIRSPLWKGGGVTFGPDKEKKVKKQVNKKERKKATASALSAKLSDDEVIGLSGIQLDNPSTARVAEILETVAEHDDWTGVGQRRNNRALVVLAEDDKNVRLSFRNFSNIAVTSADSLNALALLTYKYTILVEPKEVAEKLTERLQAKSVTV
jgi:large subunit ribosomal protein L4